VAARSEARLHPTPPLFVPDAMAEAEQALSSVVLMEARLAVLFLLAFVQRTNLPIDCLTWLAVDWMHTSNMVLGYVRPATAVCASRESAAQLVGARVSADLAKPDRCLHRQQGRVLKHRHSGLGVELGLDCARKYPPHLSST